MRIIYPVTYDQLTSWLLATITQRRLETFTGLSHVAECMPLGLSLTVPFARDDAHTQEQRKLCNVYTIDHLRPANAAAKAEVSEPRL